MKLVTLCASVVVVVVWAAAAVGAIVFGRYEALQYVTPVMLIAAGALFGVQIIRRNGERKREAHDEE